MKTGIVILAAGESARLGEPKQLLSFHGQTLLERTVETALAIAGAPVAVVLGAQAAPLRARLTNPALIVAENADWRAGLGGSLRTGLSALLAAEPELSAALFVVCDQPLLTPATLRALLAAHARSGRAIVAAEYGGTLGVPALFALSLFPELLALAGRAGAQQIIRAHRADALGVAFADGAVDIDTPADYARLQTAFRAMPTPSLA